MQKSSPAIAVGEDPWMTHVVYKPPMATIPFVPEFSKVVEFEVHAV